MATVPKAKSKNPQISPETSCTCQPGKAAIPADYIALFSEHIFTAVFMAMNDNNRYNPKESLFMHEFHTLANFTGKYDRGRKITFTDAHNLFQDKRRGIRAFRFLVDHGYFELVPGRGYIPTPRARAFLAKVGQRAVNILTQMQNFLPENE